MVFHFHYDHDIIASNDPINGPIDIKAAARDLQARSVTFLVFDYRDGHLVEASIEYKNGGVGYSDPYLQPTRSQVASLVRVSKIKSIGGI